MGLYDMFTSLKAAFGGNREKASNLFTPIWSQPVRRSTQQWLDVTMKSPRTDPMHKIASDVAATQYKLYVKNTDPARQIKKHIGLDLLDKPCSDVTITKHVLFFLTELYRLSPAGEAFWIIERNGFGVPAELWIVPPHWVQMVPTKSMPFFRVLPMGNTSYRMINVEPRDMIWFKAPDPLNPYGRGRGRAEGIGDEIETDENMSKWQKAKFYNGAMPPYIVTMEGADNDTIDRAEEKWYEKFLGSNKAHKTAFINWKADIKKMTDTEKEMEFIISRKFLRDACLQHWSMSGELFGILENANRSTIDLAYELYARNTLSVELKSFDDTLNMQFWPQFDEKLYIEHDNVIPTDDEFELKKSESGLKNGGITVDEWRLTNGYEKLPDGKGNLLYTPLNMMPTDLNSESVIENSSALQEDDEKPKGKSISSMSEEQKKKIWKLYDVAARKYEKKLEKEVKKHFQNQQNKITKALEKSLSEIEFKAASDNPDELIDWTVEINALKDILTPIWLACGEAGFDVAADLYSLDIDFNGIINPKLTDWVKESGLNHVKDITETTKNKLRASLADGIEAGEEAISLRDRVSKIYAEAKTTRALLIAENETMASLSIGNFETIKAAGFKKHQWLTAADKAVRDTHVPLNGQIRDVGKPFSNGLKYPHDPAGSAKETIRCRCVTCIVDDESEE